MEEATQSRQLTRRSRTGWQTPTPWLFQTAVANDKLRGSEQLVSIWRSMQDYTHTTNIGVTWTCWGAKGSLNCIPAGMQQITPDIGMRAFNVCICLYCIWYHGWSKFFTSIDLYEHIVIDIVPKKKLWYRWSETLGLEPPPNIIPYITGLYFDIKVMSSQVNEFLYREFFEKWLWYQS